jgi:uncharacterized membrane protein YgcG
MNPITRLARIAAAAALTALPLVGASSAPASAAVACAPVTDKADLIDDARIDLDAIPGAEVHVVAFNSVPGADIDKAVLSMRSDCSDWQSASGGWGANDLVFAVAIADRKTAIYYGPQFESHLGNDRYRSAMDAMNPRFADGDVTGGMNAGIAEIKNLLATKPSTGNTTVVNNVDNSEPIDVPWAWVLGIPVGAAALGGAGFVGVRTRRHLADRKALRTEALTLTNEAAQKFLDLETQVDMLNDRVELLPNVDDDGLNAIRADHKAAVKTAEVAINGYLAHSEKWTTTAVGDTDLVTAGEARDEAKNVKLGLTAAKNMIAAVDEDITALEERNAQTPAVLDAAAAKAADTLPILDGLDTEGYRTKAYRDRLATAQTRIETARAEHAESLWGESANTAAEAAGAIDAVHAEAKGLRERRASIEADLGQVAAKHASLGTKRANGEGDLATLVGAFHASDTNTIVESFAGGQQDHDTAAERIAEARKAVGMDEQRFGDAETALAAARDLLASADREFARPAQQHSFLNSLAGDMRNRVAKAYGDITALNQKMASNGEAMKFLKTRVDTKTLRKAVERVENDLGTERPPLTRIDGDLGQAQSDINAARSKVDSIVREYEEAQRALARARNAVRDAESQSNRSHAGSRSKSLADEAARDLRRADSAMDLALIISLSNSVVSTSSQAESAARSAISSWESSQSSSSYSSGGGSSSWGGGGSSDWGGGSSSSFDGGGGSSSW